MPFSQEQIQDRVKADVPSAIVTDFKINDSVIIIETRESYLCSVSSETSDSILLNNGLYLNPLNSGIKRITLTYSADQTIPTAIIDEFDFIYVVGNTASSTIDITIPIHPTTTQKVITFSKTGNNDLRVKGLSTDDIKLSKNSDSLQCRQTLEDGSDWSPTLSYDLMDRVPHKWEEFNEFSNNEQHFSNIEGLQNTRIFGKNDTSANLTFGTVTTGGTKTSKAFVSYIDDPSDKKMQLFSSEDVEIGTLVDGNETRIENYKFPKVASPDSLTMPTNDGNSGGVLRTDGSGNLDFDDSLTEQELLEISVNDTYTLTKDVADGRYNILIRAVANPSGNNYTIDTESSIIGWTTLKVVYDASVTNGTITVAPTSYVHGPTEFYLQKHGDYLILQKSNAFSGNFWTFMGGQCEHNGASSQVGLYSSNMYDRIRNQSVEESLTEALSPAPLNEIANPLRESYVKVEDDNEIAMVVKGVDNELSSFSAKNHQFVISNAASTPYTDTSNASAIPDSVQKGSHNGALSDFVTTNLTPTSPTDPNLSVVISSIFNCNVGNWTGSTPFDWLNGSVNTQNGDSSRNNWTEYTISNIDIGAKVRIAVQGSAASISSNAWLRFIPHEGLDGTTDEQLITGAAETYATYTSPEFIANANTVKVRIRGGNVVPYKEAVLTIEQRERVTVTPIANTMVTLAPDDTQDVIFDTLFPDTPIVEGSNVGYSPSTPTPSITETSVTECIKQMILDYGVASDGVSGTKIPNSDLDDITVNGVYRVTSSITNKPTGWVNSIVIHENFGAAYSYQIAKRTDNDTRVEILNRKKNNGVWGAWTSLDFYDNTATPELSANNLQAAIVEILNEHGGAGNTGGTTQINNINNLSANGEYTSVDTTNNPNGFASCIVKHIEYNSDDAMQYAHIMNGKQQAPNMWIRYRDSGNTWGDWRLIFGGDVGVPNGVQNPQLIGYATFDPSTMTTGTTEITYRDRGNNFLIVNNTLSAGVLQVTTDSGDFVDSTGQYSWRVHFTGVDQGDMSRWHFQGSTGAIRTLEHKVFNSGVVSLEDYNINVNSLVDVELWQNY